MNKKNLILSCLLISISLPLQARSLVPASGEIVSTIDTQTFHAQYKGKDLRVGDRVRIVEYDFNRGQKNRPSRMLPMAQRRRIVGTATVSSLLKDNYYELKSDTPQHVPAGAFIEKY